MGKMAVLQEDVTECLGLSLFEPGPDDVITGIMQDEAKVLDGKSL